MTHDEIENLVKSAAKAATLETLAALGFNVEDPPALRADMDHLRRWRMNIETVGKAGASAIVVSFCGLVLTAIGYGLKVMVGKVGP